MKQTLITLATGLFAKGLRYILTAAGGATSLASTGGETVDTEKLAGGLALVLVSFGWSLWEDWLKRKNAQAPVVTAGDTTTTTK